MDQIQFRRDTAARWDEVNPTLLSGEIGWVIDKPNQYKMGDGKNKWKDLPLRGFNGTIAPNLGNDENAVVSLKEISEHIYTLKSKEGQLINLQQQNTKYLLFSLGLKEMDVISIHTNNIPENSLLNFRDSLNNGVGQYFFNKGITDFNNLTIPHNSKFIEFRLSQLDIYNSTVSIINMDSILKREIDNQNNNLLNLVFDSTEITDNTSLAISADGLSFITVYTTNKIRVTKLIKIAKGLEIRNSFQMKDGNKTFVWFYDKDLKVVGNISTEIDDEYYRPLIVLSDDNIPKNAIYFRTQTNLISSNRPFSLSDYKTIFLGFLEYKKIKDSIDKNSKIASEKASLTSALVEFYKPSFNKDRYKFIAITDIKRSTGPSHNFNLFTIQGKTKDNKVDIIFSYAKNSEFPSSFIYDRYGYAIINWNTIKEGTNIYSRTEDIESSINGFEFPFKLPLDNYYSSLENSPIIAKYLSKNMEINNYNNYVENILNISEGITSEDILNKTSKYDSIANLSSNKNMDIKGSSFIYNLAKIANDKKTIFSMVDCFNYLDYAKQIDGVWVPKEEFEIVDWYTLNPSGISNDYEPLLYSIEVDRMFGTWLDVTLGGQNGILGDFPQALWRAGFIALVKYYYNKYKMIPIIHWHIENPYTPTGWTDSKYGNGLASRYRYTSNNLYPDYPIEHRYVAREIVENTGGECGTGRRSGAVGEPFKNPRAWFDFIFDLFIETINELTDSNGNPIPFIFRPVHEMSDNWQWWGTDCATKEDLINLFKLIVDKLHKSKNKSILIAYNPDKNAINTEDDFFRWYPGNNYVDIIACDYYGLSNKNINEISQLCYWSYKKGKIPAILETSAIAKEAWYTNSMMGIIKDSNIKLPIFALYSKSEVYGHLNQSEFDKDAILKEDLKRILKRSDVIKRKSNINLTTIINIH